MITEIGASVNHTLKTDPTVFDQTWLGRKTFEIRRDDRGFKLGDLLLLRETEYSGEEMNHESKPLKYTGRCMWVLVKHILRGPVYGLEEDWVIMSIERIQQWQAEGAPPPKIG